MRTVSKDRSHNQGRCGTSSLEDQAVRQMGGFRVSMLAISGLTTSSNIQDVVKARGVWQTSAYDS